MSVAHQGILGIQVPNQEKGTLGSDSQENTEAIKRASKML